MTHFTDRRAPHLELLNQLFASATLDASTAMSRWTGGLITLSLDEVRELPLDQAASELNLGDELLTMVVLVLEGSLGGQLILTFDEVNARRLAAALLHRPLNDSAEWSELEQSALTETGNILGCAYVNALTRVIASELVPSPPYFLQDFGASVLQQSLMSQAEVSDEVLICRTCFCREGQQLDWHVFFLPSPELRRLLETSLESVS
jgi:chemotaxis protein CheC